MFFSVAPSIPASGPSKAYLVEVTWDDWFEFSTQYMLYYVSDEGTRQAIGSLKIGAFNMPSGQRRPEIPKRFDALSEKFFSIGQSDTYYERLNSLGDEVRDYILNALNDLAKNEDLFTRAINEKVTKISLLRFVAPTTARGQFRRLANGGARLSQYQFKYKAPKNPKSNLPAITLSFQVEPESNPPTNIHVLIGRNGVGKTHIINNMISSLIDVNASPSKVGKFSSSEIIPKDELFANLVSVTFSAFDETEPPPERKDRTLGMQYSYVGLKRNKSGNESNLVPKSPTLLKNEFVKSVETCMSNAKVARWKRALEMLEADPIFKEAEVAKIAESIEEATFKESSANLFKNLSSGHKIVLLTITRLVETVEERTLVLLDEPEAHLHPPLLSAFIRVLSDLLIQRNGVAIIATHSPVVLQEVPKSCVWKLRRTGHEAVAERLEIEAFGENVGTLTREVFGLEVTHSGFHKLLIEAVTKANSFEEALSYFGEELGMEAKAIVQTLMYSKKNESR